MPLPSNMLQAVVPISSLGVLAGTGFIVNVPSEAGFGSHSYVVTAHHVIRDKDEITITVQNPFSTDGKFYEPRDIANWRQPFDDVDLVIAPYKDPLDRAVIDRRRWCAATLSRHT